MHSRHDGASRASATICCARESEILHLHFWERAFELMKRAGVIQLESEGKHAGCWVMPFESHTGTDEHESDKIIVRSNGPSPTPAKTSRTNCGSSASSGWISTTSRFASTRTACRLDNDHEPNAEVLPRSASAKFGGGETVYNVIDSRQSYPQEIVEARRRRDCSRDWRPRRAFI